MKLARSPALKGVLGHISPSHRALEGMSQDLEKPMRLWLFAGMACSASGSRSAPHALASPATFADLLSDVRAPQACVSVQEGSSLMVSNNTTHWWGAASSEGWSRLLPLALLGAVFLWLYALILSDLVADWWQDPDYSHGFLIPWLSAYFAWQRRPKLSHTIPRHNLWGLPFLLLGLVMLFLGRVGAELFLMRVSMLVVVGGLVLYLLGWGHLKVLAFPLTLLLFMIPLPAILLNAITFPLQLMAASISTSDLQLIGLPVYREGNLIFLPRLTLEVVEACSGIRSLVSLAAVAVVMAHLTQRGLWQRAVVMVSAVPIAIAVNVFRIWGTGVLAYPYGTKVAEDFYHTLSGWLIFVVAFGLLLAENFLLSRLRWRQGSPSEGQE